MVGVGSGIVPTTLLPLETIRGANSLVIESPMEVLWAYSRAYHQGTRPQNPQPKMLADYEDPLSKEDEHTDALGVGIQPASKAPAEPTAQEPVEERKRRIKMLIAHYVSLGCRAPEDDFLHGIEHP